MLYPGSTDVASSSGEGEWYRIEGTLKRSGHFAAGEPVGEWIIYDTEGKPYKVTDKGTGGQS